MFWTDVSGSCFRPNASFSPLSKNQKSGPEKGKRVCGGLIARVSAGGPPMYYSPAKDSKGDQRQGGRENKMFFDSWEEVLVRFAGAGWN